MPRRRKVSVSETIEQQIEKVQEKVLLTSFYQIKRKEE